MATDTKATLVLGGNGKTGRRVVDRLRARQLPVRVGSRSASPGFVWEDPTTWSAALDGVGAVYIAYYPDLAAPGAPAAIQAFSERALGMGVRRLVLLSGRGEEEAQRCEEILRRSDARWTILRASWFAQNFSENYLVEPILAGELTLPVGDDVGEPFVDAEDIADAAVAALTDDRHVGQLYELTGPRLVTFPQAVAEIARATGRDIRYRRISAAAYRAELERAQLPPDLVALVSYLFTEVLDGRNASTADGVTRALGRPARDFGQYVRDTAATGVWNAAASA